MAAISTGNIITSPQTITGSWVDLGVEIESLDYSFFGAYIVLDINDSEDVEFRFRGLNVTGGTEYYLPLKVIKNDRVDVKDFPYRIHVDEDQNFILGTELDIIIPIIKLQVRALTVGATAGIVTSATYRQGYRQ